MTEPFDVVSDPESQTRPSSDDFTKMMQRLLADRLHLKANHEMRYQSVFEIVPAKSGPKLTKGTRSLNGIPAVAYLPGQLTGANAMITDIAAFLQRFIIDRSVFNLTGITWKYDLMLRWTPDDLQIEGIRQSASSSNNALPGLYAAVQEQPELKLQDEKRSTQVFVVDHIDMPA